MGLFRPFISKSVESGELVQTALEIHGRLYVLSDGTTPVDFLIMCEFYDSVGNGSFYIILSPNQRIRSYFFFPELT